MKRIGVISILFGIAITIASVWVSQAQIRNELREGIRAISIASPTSSPQSQSLTQLRNEVAAARSRLERALSDLRSIKTSMIVFSRSQDLRRAQQTAEQARRSLQELQQRAEEMNSVALTVESDARDVLLSYDLALNQAAEEALKRTESSGEIFKETLIPLIGALGV